MRGLAKQRFIEKSGLKPWKENLTHVKWPLIASLVEREELEAIDFYFAERMLSDEESEEAALFLCHLHAASRDGHLCLSIQGETLIPEPLDKSLIVKIIAGAKERPGIIARADRWYLEKNLVCEQRFLTHWKKISSGLPLIPLSLNLDGVLNPKQREAVAHVMQHAVTLILGGPGTGKTYTAAKMIEAFLREAKKPFTIVVGAPTGKAAANLRVRLGASAEGCTIKTLHSLLTAPFHCDLLIVDECSMIDARLMMRLFSALKEGTRVVLLGDPHQLPPVENGAFFAELSTLEKERVVELESCLRSEFQELIDFAKGIKEGKLLSTSKVSVKPEIPRKALLRMVAEKFALSREWKWNSPKEIEELFAIYQHFRPLTPLRKGLWGVEELNASLLKEHLSLRRGDKRIPIPILIKQNDPRMDLYNGDTGFLVGEKAFFPGRVFSSALLPQYEYAYFLSVHKSQGSEYDEILLVLPEHSREFGRELIYTAVTRARKKVEIIGEKKIIEEIVAKRTQRLSGLSHAWRGRLSH